MNILTIFNKVPDGIYPCATCVHCKASIWAKLTKNSDAFYCTFGAHDTGYHSITGQKIKPDYPLCRNERYSDRNCGHDGENWKPKNKKDLFKLLARK